MHDLLTVIATHLLVASKFTYLVRMIGGKSYQTKHKTYEKDGTGDNAQCFRTAVEHFLHDHTIE